MKPTTFIMGAGVSMPYGFPSGEDLLEDVSDLASQYSSPTRPRLREVIGQHLDDISHQDIAEFGTALQRGAPRSIDHFVGLHPKYERIAKSLIAYILLQRESRILDNVFRTNINLGDARMPPKTKIPNALRHLFQQLQSSPDFSYELSKHNFITFNYERTFEHFLYNIFRYGSQLDPADAISRLNAFTNTKLIHVYGDLGGYCPESIAAQISSLTDEDLNALIGHAIHNLEFIGREQNRESLIDEMGSYFRATDQVVILGFGFEQYNTKLLHDAYVKGRYLSGQNVPVIAHKIRSAWHASAMGKVGQERNEVQRMTHIDLDNLGAPDQTDLDFLRSSIQFS